MIDRIIVKDNYVNRTVNCSNLQGPSFKKKKIVREYKSHHGWKKICTGVGFKTQGSGENSSRINININGTQITNELQHL